MTGRDREERPAGRGGSRRPGTLPAAKAAAALLSWFDPARRPMAWRETRDPYRIWVSEIMLQQTTVSTAAPYYERFLAAFPTVAALAAAPPDAVMKAWEGLGYYSRARNLHAAARAVVERHGGRLPATVEELSALPGIGRSTAGAIAAIAFGKDAPVLDGNARRVLARLDGTDGDVRRPAGQRRLFDLSASLIPPGKGRETALALMDLGNLVCRPRRPRCSECPLATWCRARARGAQEAIPARAGRRRTPHHDVVVAVLSDAAGRILIGRRPGKGLLGGLYVLPGGKREEGETLEEALARKVESDTGLSLRIAAPLPPVPHAYTHYRVTIHPFRCRLAGAGRPRPPWRFVAPGGLARYAFPRSNLRVLEAFLCGKTSGTMRPAPPGAHPRGGRSL